MEILHRKGLAPGLHNAVAAASWSGGSSLSSTSSVACSSTSNIWGRNCHPPLPLPKITWLVEGLRFPSVPERRNVCKCSSSGGDGLSSRVSIAPQRMLAPSRGARAVSSTADHCEPFSCGRTVTRVEFGDGARRVIHFRKCGGRRRGHQVMAVSSLNGIDGTGEGNVDLELEVYKFMQQSNKPDAFPTREDLVLAGRTDLVRAIDEEGGWLAAGWDESEVETNSTDAFSSGGNFATDERVGGAAAQGKDSSRPKQPGRKPKPPSLKRDSSTAGKSSRVRTDGRSQDIVERRVNGTNVVREVINAVDDEDGRRKKSNQSTTVVTDNIEPFEDFSILERVQQLPYKEKPAVVRGTKKHSRVTTDDDLPVLERLSSLLNSTEELKLNIPQRQYQQGGGGLGEDSSARNELTKSAIETTTISSKFVSSNGFQTETLVEAFPAENSVLDSRDTVIDVEAPPKRKRNPRKKKQAAKVVGDRSTDGVSGSSDWMDHLFDKREKWMFESRSKSDKNAFGASVAVDLKSFQNRIHTLSAKLVDARASLRSGREALWRTDDEEFQQRALSEFIDAEDTLEFRENAIMHARNELNTTRAEVAAMEGNLKVEIMEARKILEEKNQQTERARSASKRVRAVRIVWPNHANEVFLTGSFNGWNGQMKLEKSSAGVFVVSLPLYPGRYEVLGLACRSSLWSMDHGGLTLIVLLSTWEALRTMF